jgi:hypothetical protein
MSRLDRFLGLDDTAPRQKRAPIWKRAVWRAVKTLVRRNPGAALSAAGAGVGFAIKQGAKEGAEAASEKLHGRLPAPARKALPPPQPQAASAARSSEDAGDTDAARHRAHDATGPEGRPPLSEDEKRELIESLPPDDLRALADLARDRRE